jgi:hypothetical protein
MSPLWHYTCDHSAALIRADGNTLRPVNTLIPMIWLTDLDVPDRLGLGLTMKTLKCDRLAHRFAVPQPLEVFRWIDVRRSWRGTPGWAWVQAIESTEGALPRHWFVTNVPQAAVPA